MKVIIFQIYKYSLIYFCIANLHKTGSIKQHWVSLTNFVDQELGPSILATAWLCGMIPEAWAGKNQKAGGIACKGGVGAQTRKEQTTEQNSDLRPESMSLIQIRNLFVV